MLPPHVTSSELASVLGVTQRQVQKLAGEGVLPQLGRDKFALAPAVQAHLAYRERLVAERLAGGDQSYAEGRRRKVLAEAARIEVENRLRAGELCEVSMMVGYWQTIVSEVRSAFLRTPTKLARQLSRVREAPECETLLRKEIYQILDRLARCDPLPPDVQSNGRDKDAVAEADI
jgi:phage terminase Nu1 subunit (DNA packaging protein)